MLTDRLADILHVRPGDRITVIPVKGERRPVDVPVARVSESYIGLAAYADIHYLSRLVDGRIHHDRCSAGDEQQRVRSAGTLSRTQEHARHPIGHGTAGHDRQPDQDADQQPVSCSSAFWFCFRESCSLAASSTRRWSVWPSGSARWPPFAPWGMGRGKSAVCFCARTWLSICAGRCWDLPFGYSLVQLTSLAYEQNDLIRLPVVSAPGSGSARSCCRCVFALAAHAVVQWRVHRMDYLGGVEGDRNRSRDSRREHRFE